MGSDQTLAAGTAMGQEFKKAWTATVTLVLFAAGIITSTVSGQESCGVLGTNQNEQTVRRDEAFYLNTQNPATCDGNITSFRYCNYEPESSFFASLVTYSSIFAIYRPLDNGTYTTVSQTFTVGGSVNAINLGNYDSEDRRWPNSFGCGQLDLDTPVTVQVGDVIGACVFNSPVFGVVELNLVGATGNSNDRLLSTDVAGCAHEAVPSSVTTLTESDSLVLHIDADIVPLPTVAPTEATTEAMTTMGTEPTTSEPVTIIDTEPTTSEPVTTMDTEPTTPEPGTTPTEPPINSNSVAVEPSMVAPSPSSTEVVPTTSILNEVIPSSITTINQPHTSEAVVVQPILTSSVLPLTSLAPNVITTTSEPATTPTEPTTSEPATTPTEPTTSEPITTMDTEPVISTGETTSTTSGGIEGTDGGEVAVGVVVALLMLMGITVLILGVIFIVHWKRKKQGVMMMTASENMPRGSEMMTVGSASIKLDNNMSYGQTTAAVRTIELTPNSAYSTLITVERNEACGTRKVTLDEPEVDMSANEAYVVSGVHAGTSNAYDDDVTYYTMPDDVGQTEETEHDYIYCTIPD